MCLTRPSRGIAPRFACSFRTPQVAARTWFERRPDRYGLLPAVCKLGWSLRTDGYDLGIDVRGDVLTVLVLALAAIYEATEVILLR